MNIVMLELSLYDLSEMLKCWEYEMLILYISALDHCWKLKFSMYFQLPSINKIQNFFTVERLCKCTCRRGLYFQAWALSQLFKMIGCQN